MSTESRADLEAVRVEIQNVQESLNEDIKAQRDDLDRTLLKLMEKV